MKILILNVVFTLLITIIPLLVGWAFSVRCLSKENKLIKDKISNNTDFARAYHRLSVWYTSTILWTITEYIFVIVPFVSNVIVIYLTNINEAKDNAPVILIHSIISLSFIVFGFAINPQRHKKCYRRAFTHIDTCINEYLTNPDPNILKMGIKDGEDFIDPSNDIE